VFKPKADILNIRRDYQFVFCVFDELYISHHAWCRRCCSKSALCYRFFCFRWIKIIIIIKVWNVTFHFC